ncbi:MAG: glycosyltransferase [Acetobacter sp.]|nr:glycosyltransferase [Acetobacter sp.]
MVKVSVIMPVFNTAAYLSQCVESILGQTFSDFELICINDGSTDNSAEILASYLQKDTRVQVISQQNQGLSAARNAGMAVAQGEYIAFADSDDYYAPKFLELLLKAQETSGADIVGCEFQKIRRNTDKIKNVHKVAPKFYMNALEILLHKDNFIHFNVWNKLYKRDVIGDICFVPSIYYEDWVFNCCVFERAKGFAWIKEKLYGYRCSNSSIMRSDFNEKKLEDYVIGIREVYTYFMKNAPEKWEQVRQTRISRTVKMMMNSALRTKNDTFKHLAAQKFKALMSEDLISYKGLSLVNKIKLFKFIH